MRKRHADKILSGPSFLNDDNCFGQHSLIHTSTGLLLYFLYGQHHSREGEPVSSYSTLLTEPTPAGNTVFGSVQHTLSHVTAKIASAATDDKKPIVDQEEVGDNDL